VEHSFTTPSIISEAVAQRVPKRTVEQIKSQVAAACSQFAQTTAAPNPDPEAVNKAIADEATFADFDGTVRNKKEMLAFNSEMQSQGVYRNMKVENQSVTILSPDTAVLTMQISMQGKDPSG
jgi:hypothetical protein